MSKNEFDKKQYEDLCQYILQLATKHGAQSAELSLSIESGFSVTARLGEVETVEHHHDKGFGITVYIDHKTGSASSSDLSKEALDAVVAKACHIATYTMSDPYSGLADKNRMAFNYPELNLDHPWNINPEQGIKLAIECENAARRMDSRITNSEGATINTHRSLQIYANTHGFMGSYPSSQHSMNCILIAEQNGQMQRDYDYTISRDPSALEDIHSLAKTAAKRTLDRLGAKRLKTRTVPIIFQAQVAKTLLRNFISAVSGTNIYRKSSFLVNALHTQVFPEHINIYQKPHLLTALGSAPFDTEGVTTQDHYYVKDGVLNSFVLESYSARKLQMQTTGNAGGVYNLFISDSDLSFQQLLKTMGTGFLVTELIGQGINLVTGDYSRGAFGFWVENGEIQYPVEEVTIAGNMKDMFLNLVATGNDIDARGNILTGSMLLEKMVVAGE